MKVFVKLGLLLAIIAAGRQLRPTSMVALSAQPNAVTVAQPDTLRYTSLASTQPIPVAPVNHRTSQEKASPDFAIWY